MDRARVEFIRQAAQELDEAYEWYLERSEAAASGFLNAVEQSVRLLADRPEAWPLFEAGTRRVVVQQYPFSIIFRVHEKAIQVVAVAHHRRRPSYWRRKASSPTAR
ncbi:MAG: type II toxin-antitoxin system RelE/ParE family toxin [Acidobacteriota bacterium]